MTYLGTVGIILTCCYLLVKYKGYIQKRRHSAMLFVDVDMVCFCIDPVPESSIPCSWIWQLPWGCDHLSPV